MLAMSTMNGVIRYISMSVVSFFLDTLFNDVLHVIFIGFSWLSRTALSSAF